MNSNGDGYSDYLSGYQGLSNGYGRNPILYNAGKEERERIDSINQDLASQAGADLGALIVIILSSPYRWGIISALLSSVLMAAFFSADDFNLHIALRLAVTAVIALLSGWITHSIFRWLKPKSSRWGLYIYLGIATVTFGGLTATHIMPLWIRVPHDLTYVVILTLFVLLAARLFIPKKGTKDNRKSSYPKTLNSMTKEPFNQGGQSSWKTEKQMRKSAILSPLLAITGMTAALIGFVFVLILLDS